MRLEYRGETALHHDPVNRNKIGTFADFDWRRHDTILLDMDGTLLDLAYDNYFWLELVPRHLARIRRLPEHRVRAELLQRYTARKGSLAWYCLDHWEEELGLDIRALKSASCHRVAFLPGAREFLAAVVAHPVQVVLVTNAHGHTLDIKRDVTGLNRFFSRFVSSHDFGYAKEQAPFWPALQAQLGFDPENTLFIDDSPAVLDAAVDFGIGSVVAVTRPDTRLPATELPHHRVVEGVGNLLQ